MLFLKVTEFYWELCQIKKPYKIVLIFFETDKKM